MDIPNNRFEIDPIILECPVCLDFYNKPRILPCGHTLCEICIIDILSNNKNNNSETLSIECPECSNDTIFNNVSNFPINFLIKNIIDNKIDNKISSSYPETGLRKMELIKKNYPSKKKPAFDLQSDISNINNIKELNESELFVMDDSSIDENPHYVDVDPSINNPQYINIINDKKNNSRDCCNILSDFTSK